MKKKMPKEKEQMLKLYKQTQSRSRPRSTVFLNGKDKNRSRAGRKAEALRRIREDL